MAEDRKWEARGACRNSELNNLIEDLAQSMNSPDPENALSSGDMQGAVEAFVERHNILHPDDRLYDDDVIDAVRKRAEEIENERNKARQRRQREDKAREEYRKIAPKIPAAEGLVTRRRNALTLARAELNYFDRKSYIASGREKEMKVEIAKREKAVKAAEKKLREAEKKRDDLYKKRNAAIKIFQPSYFRNGGRTGFESNDEDIPF